MSMRNREDLTRHVAEKLQGAIVQVWEKTVTAAQMLALFTTPVILIPAPGPRKLILPTRLVVEKPAGTAFTSGTAGPLNFGYGNNPANNTLFSLALAGFTAVATKQGRTLFLPDPTNSTANAPITHINDATRLDNTDFYLRQATANLTVGDTPLRVHMYGYVLPVDLTFSW